MEARKPVGQPPNPFLSVSTFLHQHFQRLGAELNTRLDEGKRLACNLISNSPPLAPAVHKRCVRPSSPPSPPSASLTRPFASVSGQGKHVFDIALSTDQVARTLAGTSVYTVSNTNNEFVLVSDPNGVKSIGLLCFRREDAEAFLSQVQLRRRELRSQAKVVPITLDQVYMLKVEGIAFRFLPDPLQVRNALEMKSSDRGVGQFDGVPVFQSDLLTVKKRNKRYCPIYFRKEDIEKELSVSSRVPRGRYPSQHIMVGSLEDVLKKMEKSEKNSGWEDFIFIPPGKSHSQHVQEVARG